MTMKREAAFGVLVLAMFGCQGTGTATATLETDDQKASYAIGLNVGENLTQIASHVDMPALRAGIEDALADREPRLAAAELEQVMMDFSAQVQEESQAAMAAESQKNIEEGAAYLAQNSAREGVITTESGLQYEVLREGDGPQPGPEDQATVHYRGTLIDGTEFDSSYARGQPATFGVTGVIAGFAEGLQLMNVGSQYRFVIPAELAYGPGGSPPNIGPNATLIFEVELIAIP